MKVIPIVRVVGFGVRRHAICTCSQLSRSSHFFSWITVLATLLLTWSIVSAKSVVADHLQIFESNSTQHEPLGDLTPDDHHPTIEIPDHRVSGGWLNLTSTGGSQLSSQSARQRRARCPEISGRLRNGRVRIRGKGSIARFNCELGYELIGRRIATCTSRNRWSSQIPLCAGRLCQKAKAPANGHAMSLYKGAVVHFLCSPGFTIKGARTMYCVDNSRWNDTEPSCEATVRNVSVDCNFEDDNCGWQADHDHGLDWTRRHHTNTMVKPTQPLAQNISNSVYYDHTYGQGNEGYYLFLESWQMSSDEGLLFSPVLQPDRSNSCLSFWYHISNLGQTPALSQGSRLRIYVKPESSALNTDESEFAWNTSIAEAGDLSWLKGSLNIPIQTELFQIVFVGTINGHVAMGLDDISLNLGSCPIGQSSANGDVRNSTNSSDSDSQPSEVEEKDAEAEDDKENYEEEVVACENKCNQSQSSISLNDRQQDNNCSCLFIDCREEQSPPNGSKNCNANCSESNGTRSVLANGTDSGINHRPLCNTANLTLVETQKSNSTSTKPLLRLSKDEQERGRVNSPAPSIELSATSPAHNDRSLLPDNGATSLDHTSASVAVQPSSSVLVHESSTISLPVPVITITNESTDVEKATTVAATISTSSGVSSSPSSVILVSSPSEHYFATSEPSSLLTSALDSSSASLTTNHALQSITATTTDQKRENFLLPSSSDMSATSAPVRADLTPSRLPQNTLSSTIRTVSTADTTGPADNIDGLVKYNADSGIASGTRAATTQPKTTSARQSVETTSQMTSDTSTSTLGEDKPTTLFAATIASSSKERTLSSATSTSTPSKSVDSHFSPLSSSTSLVTQSVPLTETTSKLTSTSSSASSSLPSASSYTTVSESRSNERFKHPLPFTTGGPTDESKSLVGPKDEITSSNTSFDRIHLKSRQTKRPDIRNDGLSPKSSSIEVRTAVKVTAPESGSSLPATASKVSAKGILQGNLDHLNSSTPSSKASAWYYLVLPAVGLAVAILTVVGSVITLKLRIRRRASAEDAEMSLLALN